MMAVLFLHRWLRCAMDAAAHVPVGAIAACISSLISVNTSGWCANTLEPDGV